MVFKFKFYRTWRLGFRIRGRAVDCKEGLVGTLCASNLGLKISASPLYACMLGEGGFMTNTSRIEKGQGDYCKYKNGVCEHGDYRRNSIQDVEGTIWCH